MSNPTYMAYLLRLWREREEGTWRAMLENPHAAERINFATLSDLVAYLEYRTGDRAGDDELPQSPSQGNTG